MDREVVRMGPDANPDANPDPIGTYIAGFPPATQALLAELRQLIREVVPDATETISYAIPTFDLDGTHLVHFAGFAKHIGVYPMPSGMSAFEAELSSYRRGKGSVRLPLDQPLPRELIRRIVEFRVGEVRGPAGGARAHVTLIPFVLDRDLSLLDSWLQQPHVSRWWGDPLKALEEVSQPPAGGGEALIAADGVPVGYVRWQVPAREELDAAGLSEIPHDIVDIDIAIGEVDVLGKGIGSQALSILRERLVRDGVNRIMLATSVENERAVRAYEKAGFTRRRQFVDTDGGRYWLMMFEVTPG